MSFLARTVILLAAGLFLYVATGVAFQVVDPIYFILKDAGGADPISSLASMLFWLRLSLTLLVMVVLGWFIFAPLREDTYTGRV